MSELPKRHPDLTDARFKALRILKDTGPRKMFTAKAFALNMWPDSDMHLKHSNQGRGACVGKAGWLAGGSFLGKMAKATGWVRVVFIGDSAGWGITEEGKKILQDEEMRLHYLMNHSAIGFDDEV